MMKKKNLVSLLVIALSVFGQGDVSASSLIAGQKEASDAMKPRLVVCTWSLTTWSRW